MQRPIAILLPGLLLAACGEADPPAAPASPAGAAPAAAPAGWSHQASGGGAAVWASGSGDSVSFACDRASSALVITRAGLQQPQAGTLRVQSSAGARDLTAQQAGEGALSASLPMDDPFVASLRSATGPLEITTGGATVATAPLTSTLRRVIRDCRAPAPAAAAGAPASSEPTTYECLDGNTVTAVYPDASTAVVTQAGRSYRMTLADAPRGTRYVGEGRQWWLQGRGRFSSGTLGELKAGETQASDPGLLCKGKNPEAG